MREACQRQAAPADGEARGGQPVAMEEEGGGDVIGQGGAPERWRCCACGEGSCLPRACVPAWVDLGLGPVVG